MFKKIPLKKRGIYGILFLEVDVASAFIADVFFSLLLSNDTPHHKH
jgi:hypothetical protein